MWHFPGSPEFLARQARRLGLDKHKINHVRACQTSPDLYILSNIIGQLCGRYRERLLPGGLRLSEPELKGIAATLERCELEVRKLHLTAASADDMLGEAYRVFDLTRERNPFEILSDFDAGDLAPVSTPPRNDPETPASNAFPEPGDSTDE